MRRPACRLRRGPGRRSSWLSCFSPQASSPRTSSSAADRRANYRAVDTPKPPAAAVSPQPLGGDAAPIALPPLAESDPLVRELVRKLSSHPSVTAWLATDGLIRNFTVVASNVADGTRFTMLLPKLRPSSPFLAAKRNNDVYDSITKEPEANGRASRIGDDVVRKGRFTSDAACALCRSVTPATHRTPPGGNGDPW